MGIEVNGLADTFEALDDLEDDFSGPTEDWVVGSPQEYAPPLEYGASPHVIEGNPLLYFENEEGQLISKRSVKHPGNDPNPHWRPAVNEVRLKGPLDFIESNSRKRASDIESTEELIRTLAFALEGNIKRRITKLGLIDTGAYRASVGAVPVSDLSELRDS
jgi:hypothetical protein